MRELDDEQREAGLDIWRQWEEGGENQQAAIALGFTELLCWLTQNHRDVMNEWIDRDGVPVEAQAEAVVGMAIIESALEDEP